MKKGKDGFYNKYIKRMLDIICALAAMIVFCWLYAIIAILVKVKLGSPVIFKQTRPGKNEKLFHIYKFRTMTDEYDLDGNPLPDDIRLTKFGKWLRSTSLDELPEIWNILKGDMSVIGPRPLLIEYLPFYSEIERHRHDVRPGLTGLAQVSGRNSVEWSARFAMDVEYVQNISLKNDIKIILQTVKNVISHNGVAENTRETEGNFAEIRKNEFAKTL